MTLYVDYNFTIDQGGLKLSDKERDDKDFNQVKVDRTPLTIGDKFILELDQDGCMFFRKTGNEFMDHKQMELDFG
jgi:hypothetical protein